MSEFGATVISPRTVPDEVVEIQGRGIDKIPRSRNISIVHRIMLKSNITAEEMEKFNPRAPFDVAALRYNMREWWS